MSVKAPRIFMAALAVAGGLSPSLAAAQSVFVPGSSNPFLAGAPDTTACCSGDSAPGQSPALAPVSVSGGQTLTFSATGLTDGAGTGSTGPDGAYTFNMADYGTGIAPANGVGVLGLVGVFLDAGVPSGGSQPGALDFSSGLNFLSLAPGLDQIFWIGDGLTGTGSGAVQQFIAPTGATRLFLGTVDGFQWNNNTGGYDVSISSVRSAVPEPATWAMMLAGFGMVGVAMRKRNVRTTVSYA